MSADLQYLFLLIGIILLCLFATAIYKAKGTNRTERIIINVVLVICFSLVIAFRPDNVPDTLSYKEIFSNIKTNVSYGFDIFGESERVEYGFLYLIKFFKVFSNNIKLFFFIVCFVSVSIFLYGMHKIVIRLMHRRMSVPTVLAVYITYFGIYYNGIVIRQGLAMALCILSFAMIVNKKYLKSLLAWFFAFLFHRLSFIFIIIILLYYVFSLFRISQNGYLVIILTCLCISIFGIGYSVNQYLFSFLLKILGVFKLDSAYSHYLTDLTAQNNSFPLYLTFQIFCGLILVYFTGRKKVLKNLFNIYIIGIIIMTLFVGTFAINRGVDYFLMFSLLVIGCSLTVSESHIKNDDHTIIQVNGNQRSVLGIFKNVPVVTKRIILIGLMMLGYFLAVSNIIFPDLISLSILH